MEELISKQPAPSTITIKHSLLQVITDHINVCLPEEGCGLLFGLKDHNQTWVIEDFIPCANVSDNPIRQFVLEPSTWIKACFSSNLIGIIHSHPVSPATPSAADLEQLQQFGALIGIYIIMSAGHTTNPHFTGYTVEQGSDQSFSLMKSQLLAVT